MKAESFGYKNAWFACRAGSASEVAAALQLEQVASASWQVGVEASYASGRDSPHVGDVFVTSPVDGWVLAVGRALWTLNDSQPPRVMAWCAKLSQALGGAEVQYFSTYRVVEAHAWGRAIGGVANRSYILVDGEIREDFGGQSDEEQRLGFKFFDFGSSEAEDDGYLEREDLELPNEDHVMRLAAAWSVDPSAFQERALEVGSGLLGRIALPEPNYAVRSKIAPPIVAPTAIERGEARVAGVSVASRARNRPWWRFW